MSLLIWCVFFVMVAFSREIPERELIEKINSIQNSWKASANRFTNLNFDTKKIYLGTKFKNSKYISRNIHTESGQRKENVEIPKTFDARKQWKNCPSIGAIKDQGACASDWAVAAATIASDRLCIASKSKINVNISVEDLVSCDNWCSGCYGCDFEFPWIYMMRFGVVTGGDYGSNEGCKPYSVEPCGSNCDYTRLITQNCTGICSNSAYDRFYTNDKYFGTSLYELPAKDHKSMQTEILTRGPVASMMKVYEDIYSYKEGVYAHVYGNFVGYHSVKILGWGTKSGIKYWLVANSWGKDFGQNGYFRIRRGVNECFIEGRIIGSQFKV